jgi:hypothetical protein
MRAAVSIEVGYTVGSPTTRAKVAELADAPDLGSGAQKA